MLCLAGEAEVDAAVFAAGEADGDAAGALDFLSAAKVSGAQMSAVIQTLLMITVLFFIVLFLVGEGRSWTRMS